MAITRAQAEQALKAASGGVDPPGALHPPSE